MEKETITVGRYVVIFTDLHEFSIVMKELGKNKTLDFLQETYDKLGELIVTNGGEIVKYMGDSILSIFPEGKETNAITCALAMRKKYDEIVRQRNISHETELEIGISAGEMETGVIGHRTLRYKDIFGEAVNEAAMICHHRGIAITEAVFREIKEKFETVELPEKNLKWREVPLLVWEIIEK